MKKGCFVGKLVKETWLFICLHLRSVIPEVHEILRLTHQWQGPSTPSFLREQKDSSAHIAEAKITLMIFIFPVVHTHCPVKIEKGRSACCQISTDATLQSSPQVHVRAREWSWVQYRLQLICYSSQFHDALVWLWAMRAPELIVFLMILSQIKVCPNYTWLLLFSLKLLQVAQFLVCKTYGCLLLGKVLKCISYSTLKPGRINKSRVRHDWSDLAAAEAVLPTDSTLGRLTSYQSSSSQAFSSVQFSSVQLLSCVRLFVTPWTAAPQASLSITNSRSLLKLKSIESVMPSNHIILCCPLLLPPSVFPSIRIFSNESALCIRWPKYWSFSFSISPSNEHPGLISFRMDWLDLLAVQGTL